MIEIPIWLLVIQSLLSTVFLFIIVLACYVICFTDAPISKHEVVELQTQLAEAKSIATDYKISQQLANRCLKDYINSLEVRGLYKHENK